MNGLVHGDSGKRAAEVGSRICASATPGLTDWTRFLDCEGDDGTEGDELYDCPDHAAFALTYLNSLTKSAAPVASLETAF